MYLGTKSNNLKDQLNLKEKKKEKKKKKMSSFAVIIALSYLLLCLLLLVGVNGDEGDKREVYVVYMGAVPSQTSENTLKKYHIQILASILPRFNLFK